MKLRQAKKIGRSPKGTHSLSSIRRASNRVLKYDKCKFGECCNYDEFLLVIDPYPQFGGLQYFTRKPVKVRKNRHTDELKQWRRVICSDVGRVDVVFSEYVLTTDAEVSRVAAEQSFITKDMSRRSIEYYSGLKEVKPKILDGEGLEWSFAYVRTVS